MELLPSVRDVPGVLQPLSFGHVRGVVYGAAFPYLQTSVQWDSHIQSTVGTVGLLLLWRQLVEVLSVLTNLGLLSVD